MTTNVCLIFLICILPSAFCVRCYQCASSQDSKGDDTCGAYKKFDRESHIAVECSSDESHMPGSFCMKLTQQSPRGFIWDGRWRQVIRRCASIADNGVTGVCNWGVYPNGVYWEECYCSSDECNSSTFLKSSLVVILSTITFALLLKCML
ncbi:uncharacterized protein LOC128675172 [Plodia interpunctella]|uniref:uncharacterized protein LOC128675172 n=1 Tax=Plodia interpunctella TaxID=58824 RepID=UPI002367C9C4|nr:uncharacterized protein LOC128675172 [Plodia interpunctella]